MYAQATTVLPIYEVVELEVIVITINAPEEK